MVKLAEFEQSIALIYETKYVDTRNEQPGTKFYSTSVQLRKIKRFRDWGLLI